jgi:tetratricopeptide (TPR) repeat protein
MLYTETLDYRQAANLEERYAESATADVGALTRAAGLYLNGGDAEAALRVARAAVERDPSAAARNILGRAAWAAGQRQEALDSLAAASKAEPANGTYAFDLSQVLFLKGDFSLAADVLATALDAHPADPQLQLALGVARYGQRRFDDAATAFLKTISLSPELAQPYDFLGKMLDQLSARLPEITRAYEARYAREPKNYDASFLLAKVRTASHGDDAGIEKLLRESIFRKANFWESHFELGQLLARQRHFADAASELRKAIQFDPKQPMPHYHLARVYDRLGESDKAKTERDIHARLSDEQKGTSGMQ